MNHNRTLREVAKVATGLVLADLISVFWFSAAGMLPLTLLGVTWTSQMLPEIVVFDGALLLLLIHYGWNMRLPVSSPSERTLLMIAGIIFLVVSLAHLVRLLFNVSVAFGGLELPLWISWAGFLLAGYLAYSSFSFARRLRR